MAPAAMMRTAPATASICSAGPAVPPASTCAPTSPGTWSATMASGAAPPTRSRPPSAAATAAARRVAPARWRAGTAPPRAWTAGAIEPRPRSPLRDGAVVVAPQRVAPVAGALRGLDDRLLVDVDAQSGARQRGDEAALYLEVVLV